MTTLIRADAGDMRVAGRDVVRGPAAVRAAVGGTGHGNSATLTIGWCTLIASGGYLWARKRYNREPSR
ncbi:hypothetical protein AB0D10_25750 [Kitasatospora sp. NPDC048545]|uniref:hypothetical protein n=1 Tax=Kitasatospora sp. NPDC048545 TaxID=3157208 RepID=UPI00340A306E